jgi:hypothetical protein
MEALLYGVPGRIAGEVLRLEERFCGRGNEAAVRRRVVQPVLGQMVMKLTLTAGVRVVYFMYNSPALRGLGSLYGCPFLCARKKGGRA